MTGEPIEAIVELIRDLLREGLSKYTRKAFQMLPELNKPCILDIGCGSGVPTMELARLNDGQVMGLDIDQRLLDRLSAKIETAGLSDRVTTVNCSMLDMEFPDESFDIIWSEGSVSVVGFERGLKEWRRFIKPGGFLVIGDQMGDLTEKLAQVSACGYELLGYLTLDEGIWWNEYYTPLEKLISEVRKARAGDPKALAVLDTEQQEIDMFKRNTRRYRSVFFALEKRPAVELDWPGR